MVKIISMTTSRSVILKAADLAASTDKIKFWNPEIAGPSRSPRGAALFRSQEFSANNLANSVEFRPPSLLNERQNGSYENMMRDIEDQIDEVREQLEDSRKLNQDLIKEINKSNNEVRISTALSEQLTASRDQIYSELVKAHEQLNSAQTEKIGLMEEISAVKIQKNIQDNRVEILEEQVTQMKGFLTSLNQQVYSQKDLVSELQRENASLKEKLQQYQRFSQQCEKMEESIAKTATINETITQRVSYLENELAGANEYIEELGRQGTQLLDEHNRTLKRMEEVESYNSALQEQLNALRESLRLRDSELMTVQANEAEFEERYRKIMIDMQGRIDELVEEVMVLDRRNRELVDEKHEVEQKFAGNTTFQNIGSKQFMTILKEESNEIGILNKKLHIKEDELVYLKQKHEEEEVTWRQKVEELSNSLKIREAQDRNRDLHYEIELESLKKECAYLTRKTEEQKSREEALKAEIAEKDRIIMNHIEGTKRSRVMSQNGK